MTTTVTILPATRPANYPLSVTPNVCEESKQTFPHLVRTRDGWPVALFHQAEHAEWFVAAANGAVGG